MKKIISITDFPKSIKYGGKVYFLSVGVTAWNKLNFAYRGINRESILSEVVENENSAPYSTDDVNDIVDVPNFETALYVAYYRLIDAIENGVVNIYKM